MKKKGVQKNFVPAELIPSELFLNPQYRAEKTVIDSARRALSIGEVSAKKEPIRPGKRHFEERAFKKVGKSSKSQTVASTPSKPFFPSFFKDLLDHPLGKRLVVAVGLSIHKVDQTRCTSKICQMCQNLLCRVFNLLHLI